MADPTNDIDALLAFLEDGCDFGCECGSETAKRHHAALTALVAERDEYKARCKAQHEVMTDMVGKEREANRDRDLRERLLESVLGNVDVGGLRRIEVELMGKMAVWTVDAAIAEMRKGATDGK